MAKAKAAHPQVRDGEATKRAILDAAEEEFSQFGLLGARTEAIAEKSGVSKAMIHYHFETKEKLYLATLERAFMTRLRNAQSVDIETVPPPVALERYLRSYLTDVGNHPRHAQMFLFEALQNKGRYYSMFSSQSLYVPLTKIIERGIAEGVFRKVHPLHTAVNIVGTCIFYLCALENVKSLWGDQDLLSPEMMQTHTQEALDLILSGLKKT